MTETIDIGRKLGTARTAPERKVEAVLATIEQWRGLELSYAPVPGGLQNSNWAISVPGSMRRYFLKVPGEGSEAWIDRGLANEAAARAAKLGIGPQVVLFDNTTGVEAIEFLEDYRACTNGDFKNLDIPREIMTLYRDMHSGEQLSVTKTAFDMIDEHLDQAQSLGAPLPTSIAPTLAEYAVVKEAMLAGGLDLVAAHNDPMPGNFLISETGPMRIVDYEFASNNERAYEIGVLLAEMFYTDEQVTELVENYYGESSFATLARVHVCMALADLKWGLWGCTNQVVNRQSDGWDFDYHKYGVWKLLRSQHKMADPRWAYWVASL